MRIIFMGSPDFSIPSLEAINENFQLVAVITAPDKPAGRGHHLQETEVKNWALKHEVKLMQPERLKATSFIHEIKSLKPDLFVVVAFRMIPSKLMELAPFGAINLHGSLLPQYRGAAPIQRAIMAGETHSGVTVFKLDADIDTGKIIKQAVIPIGEHSTGGEIYDVMKNRGAELLVQAITEMRAGKIVYTEQDETKVSFAPKIYRDDCKIDFGADVRSTYNKIRALLPYPCAWFEWRGVSIKVLKAQIDKCSQVKQPGPLFSDQKKLWMVCKDGCIELIRVKPEGKKEMTAVEFINGYGFNSGINVVST